MGRDIAITESYLTSVFKLSNQEKKATLSTIKKLSEVTRSTALKIHDIDKVKCDKKLRSARVNKDLRIIFMMQGDVYTMLYVDHHDDAYKWCEGKYLGKTNFGAEYIYDEKKFSTKEEYSYTEENQYYFDNKSLLETNGVKLKNLIKLGISDIHAEILMKMTDENRLLDYIMVFPEEIQEAILDMASGARTFEEVFNGLMDIDDREEVIKGIEEKDPKRRFYITKSIDELEYLMDNDDFEKWKIFLHPSQNKLAYGNYNGPTLVEGGPGTGKTIVGIHRAVYLSEHIFMLENNKKILICTYSKKY